MSRVIKIVAFAALLVAAASYSAVVKSHRWQESWRTKSLEAGAAAPPLALPDLQGDTVELRSVAADRRLVVVSFWGVWCDPCRAELKDLARLYSERSEDGLEVLAVSIGGFRRDVDRFVEEEQLPFEVLLDDESQTWSSYGLRVLPTTVLVGPDGTVVRAIEGRDRALEGQIEYYLGRMGSHG